MKLSNGFWLSGGLTSLLGIAGILVGLWLGATLSQPTSWDYGSFSVVNTSDKSHIFIANESKVKVVPDNRSAITIGNINISSYGSHLIDSTAYIEVNCFDSIIIYSVDNDRVCRVYEYRKR